MFVLILQIIDGFMKDLFCALLTTILLLVKTVIKIIYLSFHFYAALFLKLLNSKNIVSSKLLAFTYCGFFLECLLYLR